MQWIKCVDRLPEYDGKKIKFRTENEELNGWYLPPLFLSDKDTAPSVYGKDVIEWK